MRARTSSARPEARTPASSSRTPSAAAGVECFREDAADQPPASLAEQPAGGRVGLGDLVGEGVEHQHRFGRHLEQQPVAHFHMAQPRVVTLDRLLRVHQALLQGGDGAQVAAEGHHPLAGADADGGIQHRHRVRRRGGAAGRALVDMPPARGDAGGGVVQKAVHLGAALRRYGVGPALAGPVSVAFQFLGEIVALEGDVMDHPVGIQDKGDIGGRGNECSGRFRVQIPKRPLRRLERLHEKPGPRQLLASQLLATVPLKSPPSAGLAFCQSLVARRATRFSACKVA